MNADVITAEVPAARSAAPVNAKLGLMLNGPIARTLIGLAWPNLLMMLAQSATGLIETWFLSRLGTEVLAGVGLVVPVMMLMQNMSQGAMGGGTSSAVARALGAGNKDEAERLVWQALLLNTALGIVLAVLLLSFGRPLYRLMGAEGATLDAALTYSTIVFCGLPLMWAMNALASALRGTGNMVVPGAVICGGALLLVPVSPCLIFGWGPFPPLGVAGAGVALLLYFGLGLMVLAWYCHSGRSPARLRRGRLSWPLMRSILSVGALATLNPLLTNTLIAVSTALVGAYAGTAALAGYATGARLEYLLQPIAFGLGAPMVAMVASNLGAGQRQRATRIALVGGAIAFVLAEVIGLAAACWPRAWLELFGSDDSLVTTGSHYLHLVGPFYGFYALGFSLYFACQGAGRLKWPLLAGLIRLVIAVGGGWLVLRLTGSITGFFILAALAMFAYGTIIVWTVAAQARAATAHSSGGRS